MRLNERAARLEGRCWFCGDKGSLSKEHAIPQWAIKLAKPKATGFRHEVGRPVDMNDPNTPYIYGRGRNAGRNDIGGHWARVACEACNNNWMSQLQEQAKPIVTPFIMGDIPTINFEESRILARWLYVIVACSEYYLGWPRIDQKFRTILMTGDMLPRWEISHGYSADESLNCLVQINHRGEELPNEIFDMFFVSAWVTIGSVVFHCAAARAVWDVFNALGPYPEFQARYGLRSIFPPMQAQPPGAPGELTFPIISDAQKAIYSRRFAPKRSFEPEDCSYLL